MRAYKDLLAIRAKQKDIFARSDPIEPTSPPSPAHEVEPLPQLHVDEIQVDTSDPSTVLGSGGYGNVYRGTCRSIAVAVKILNKGFDPKSQEAFMKEAQLLSTIYHPHICLFLGACFGPPLMLVSELLENGDLDHLLKSDMELSLFVRMRMMRDVARAMCWLHDRSSPILHRDLKPANVVIDSKWVVKICDFGLSEVLIFKMGKDVPGQVKGSPLWMSPEVLDQKDQFFTTAADVYSYGVVLWQCLSRVQPWANVRDIRTLKKLVCQDGKRPIIPEECPRVLRQLIESCWAQQPSDRPPFGVILQKLEDFLISVAISDPTAARFWQQNFFGKEFVPWSVFQPAMESFMQADEPPESLELSDNSLEIRINCVKAMLGVTDNVIELFGRVLRWLGPWRGDFPKRVERLLRKPWFHGDVPTHVAQDLVSDRPPGTFLVRFSNSKMGSFTVTRMSSSKGVVNLRIDRDDNLKFNYLNSPAYDTLVDLVENEHELLGVTVAAPGSPYSKIVSGNAQVIANYEYDQQSE